MSTTPQDSDSSRLSVALCIGQLEPGGAERCLAQLAVGLDRKHFAPVVYCLGRPPQSPRNILHDQLVAAGVELHYLRVWPRWRMAATALKLARALRRQRPAVLQTFLYRANVAGALAVRLARVPHVAAGIRVADPRGKFRLFVERKATGNVERYVCVSQSVADFSRDLGRLPQQKLVVIPNGIDPTQFDGQPANLAEFGVPIGRGALCVVGRLDRQKNLAWLLREAGQLLTALPRHDLLLVGEGPQEKKLKKYCAEKGLADRVHFTGWRPDVARILAACDLLVLPSSWEGMPNVLLEAMAAGRPVVAADVEGVRQVLGSLAPQQVVPINNGRLLRERIVAILGNPQLAERLGHENRTRVQHEFSARAMIEAYQRLFLSMARR